MLDGLLNRISSEKNLSCGRKIFFSEEYLAMVAEFHAGNGWGAQRGMVSRLKLRIANQT